MFVAANSNLIYFGFIKIMGQKSAEQTKQCKPDAFPCPITHNCHAVTILLE